MDERFLFLAILLPIIGGVLTPVIGKRSQKALYGWVFAVSIATSLLTYCKILHDNHFIVYENKKPVAHKIQK